MYVYIYHTGRLAVLEVGSNEVFVLCYCTKYIFQVSVLYLSIYFSDDFLFLLPTFEHKYLYFLFLTLLKQAFSIGDIIKRRHEKIGSAPNISDFVYFWY